MELKRRKIPILGVDVDDISQNMAISTTLELAKDKAGRHLVVTVNSEFVMFARRNKEFAGILKGADLALADGKGVVLAKLILGGREQNRITGVDLLVKLCSLSAKKAITVGFLGGFGNVAERVGKRQIEANPALKVVFAQAGDPAIGQDLRLRKAINGVGRIDILFVAYGMGRQEFWVQRNKKFLNVGVFIGVGGAFDYVSMVKKRAPVWFQDTGLEWLWRLFWEPGRIWRMRVLPAFVILVIWQYITKMAKIAIF